MQIRGRSALTSRGADVRIGAILLALSVGAWLGSSPVRAELAREPISQHVEAAVRAGPPRDDPLAIYETDPKHIDFVALLTKALRDGDLAGSVVEAEPEFAQ